jgi:hypothetical protein
MIRGWIEAGARLRWARWLWLAGIPILAICVAPLALVEAPTTFGPSPSNSEISAFELAVQGTATALAIQPIQLPTDPVTPTQTPRPTNTSTITPTPTPTGPQALLPDIQTLPLEDIHLVYDRLSDSTFVRLTNIVYNAGPGPLVLEGGTSQFQSDVQVAQRLLLDDESFEYLPAGSFEFDRQHNHWHLQSFARYEVLTVRANGELGVVIGSNDKVGYCLRDGFYAGPTPEAGESIPRAQYGACYSNLQGLSPGFADPYYSSYAGQWVEISGVEDGIYALRSSADPENAILEVDETNNQTVVFFELANSEIKLLANLETPTPDGEKTDE